MAEKDPNAASGRDGDSEVHEGNDGFAAAFDTLAAGDALEASPAAQDDDADEGADDAGQDGADDADESPQNEGAGKDPPAKAPASAAAGNAPDPWANATPEMIAERDRLKAELEAERRRTAGASGRASGLARELNALKASATGQPVDGANKGEKSDAEKALDTEIETLKADYPEIAGPLIKMLEGQRDEIAKLKGTVAPIAAADEQEAIVAQTQALEAQHSDWRHFGTEDHPAYLAWIAAQPNAAAIRTERASFLGWLGEQTPTIQALADSMDAREVSVAISLFKSERARATGGADDAAPGKNATDVRRRRQLDGGRLVDSRPANAASGAPDDFTSAFEHFGKAKKA